MVLLVKHPLVPEADDSVSTFPVKPKSFAIAQVVISFE